MTLGTEKTQFEMSMLKAETKTLLWKENKDGKKHPQKKMRNKKEIEMREAKEISKQEEMSKGCESRQVGGTEKVKEKSKEFL